MVRTGAANVGGRQFAVGVTGFEKAVAAVMMSVIGSGGAEYRVGEIEKAVDTVFLGVFDRRAGDEVGWFDESLIRNQDYELNIRLRDAGGLVWFDPNLFVEYRPRSSLRAVGRQYFDYGFSRQKLRLHRSSWKIRQVLPPVTLSMLALSLVVGVWFMPALLVALAYFVLFGWCSWIGSDACKGAFDRSSHALLMEFRSINWSFEVSLEDLMIHALGDKGVL